MALNYLSLRKLSIRDLFLAVVAILYDAVPDDEPPPEEPDEAEQGLFVCLPAGNMELSRFGGDGERPPMAPGPAFRYL